MENSGYFIAIGGVILLGVVLTVAYTFARYFFRAHKDDKEIAPGLKNNELPQKAETSEELQQTLDSIDELKESLEEQTEPIPKPPQQEAGNLQKAAEPAPDAPSADPKSVEVQPPKKPSRKSLGDALANTKANLFGRIKESLIGKQTLSEDDIEALEEVLYTSDMGPMTVERLMTAVGETLNRSDKKQLSVVQEALRAEMVKIFGATSSDVSTLTESLGMTPKPKTTQVWMIVGVNGAGKTTSIGKLAHLASSEGLKVLVAAGDTFRAAAGEQLKTWSDRANVEIFFPENVSDPSAVAFDACQKGVSGEFDVVIVDTAGRLHTQDNLMEELKKMKRVIQKVIEEGPHQTLIVLDANSGQNALIQARSFNQALELSGAILTKLDGTAKGGVAVGLACELSLPIKAIGVGEGLEDIRPFATKEFVDSII